MTDMPTRTSTAALPALVQSVFPGALALVLLALSACGDPFVPETEPGDPSRVAASWPIPRKGATGEPYPERPAVRVTDRDGRPVPGVEVVFTVEAGGGALSNSTAVTDGASVAQAGTWVLGPALGVQRVVARAGALSAALSVTAEWAWAPAGTLYDQHLTGVLVHPEDDRLWFAVNHLEALYLSEDGGETWALTIPEAGVNENGLRIDPTAPDTVFAGVRNRLMVSGDRGRTWEVRHAFSSGYDIRSVLVSARDGAVLVAPQKGRGDSPSVYRSEDRGRTWTEHALGGDAGWYVPWDLEEDPTTGTIWAGIEIADHPAPYRPPFLASADGGRTWEDVTDRLPFLGNPWHVIEVEAAGGALYALTEGAGLFRSTDGGARWRYLGRTFSASLRVDPRHPDMVFGGAFRGHGEDGGVFVSFDRGDTFQRAGTAGPPGSGGHTVSGFALSADGSRLYMSSFGSGIMAAELPK